jgi:aryl-alcohol dehydrogenase-like predicted oxidoreductase
MFELLQLSNINMVKKIHKICLGTVQLGLNYGINNSFGQPNAEQAQEILNCALELDILDLDTATAYGSSLERIALSSSNKFLIHSKWSKDPEAELSFTLNKLKSSRIESWLAHNVDEVINNRGKWEAMKSQKDKGLVNDIGFSLYSPEKLAQLLDMNIKPTIVQVPYNIFDTSFKSYFPVLKEIGCKIHTRSAYLQGLFFKNPQTLGSYFDSVRDWLEVFHKKIPSDTDKAAYLLGFVLLDKSIDKVVVGVDLPQHLRQLEEAIKKPFIPMMEQLEIVDRKIINPGLWPK